MHTKKEGEVEGFRRFIIQFDRSFPMVLGRADHTIVHFEIPADNIEKLRKFYSELFGWKIEKTPGPTEYWNIQTVPVDEKGEPIRHSVNGGMMKFAIMQSIM